MAEFINITNDNSVTVIDDIFNIPKLIYRKKIATNTARSTTTPYVRMLTPQWEFLGSEVIGEASTLRELGFDYDVPTTEEAQTALLNKINSHLIPFARCDSNVLFGVSCSLQFTKSTSTYRLIAFTRSDIVGTAIELCIYAMNINLVAPPYGVYGYNEQGEYIFDAMRGCMQNIGVLEGSLSMGSTIARTYDIAVPTGLDAKNVFISFRSTLPYYAAYNISSGGVSFADSAYAPKMTITDSNVKVELTKQKTTGSNSAYSIGNYFENVIYVIQPAGLYLF